jgi:polyphosphate kinase 2 (PPK2 family)
MGHLDEADLTQTLSREDEERELEAAWKRLSELRLTLGGLIGEEKRLGPPLCVVFEGWDASGKGGAIKRLVSPLDPRHVRVSQFAAPSADEKRHHFLHRFWPALPGWGGMTVFDRSWYGRVLVERVEGFATEDEWSRAYGEIETFERMLAEEGTILVKFWLHLSPEEQLKRFESRAGNPLKAWKLTPEDWRNREKRDAYERAVEEMIDRTDHPHARWHVVAGESKRYARTRVVAVAIEEIEAGMRRWGSEPPANGGPQRGRRR